MPPPLPPKKKGVGNYFWVPHEQNQICSKLPEMARKLVKNYFLIFAPPPPRPKQKTHNWGRKENLVKEKRKEELLQFA